MEIPIEKIFAYSMLKNPTKEQTEQQFEIMKNISWQDFENLSKQELEKIPVGWIYDWEKITGTNHSQKQIENLYKKHNIKTFPLHQYQTKFSRPIPPHDDVNQILIVPELKYYIHTFLIYNNDFIEDVIFDKFIVQYTGDN